MADGYRGEPLSARPHKNRSQKLVERAILWNQKRRKNQNRDFRLRGDDCCPIQLLGLLDSSCWCCDAKLIENVYRGLTFIFRSYLLRDGFDFLSKRAFFPSRLWSSYSGFRFLYLIYPQE